MKKAIQLGAITVSMIASLGLEVRADAARVNFEGNSAKSIEDLQVGEKLYNVSFIYDSAINLFDPAKSTSTTLLDDPEALTATNAITTLLNSQASVPLLVGGKNAFFVPIGPYDSGAIAEFGSFYSLGRWDLDERSQAGFPQPIMSEISLNYATFTKVAPVEVPEPSEILGSLTALGLLIAMKRKSN
ncbi:PEP-CTERM sorting domain-containing protein [Nostoc sp. MG11]|uniref:PEP-CTERM sorting domain-containing protein n=1 Tax=Nostoc sp. MG11 TaxID=2721166 RepID=UPI00186679B5|nr:PEP-CTERM sorting domain-containing protein [Nostoc sp. MG11]